MFKKSVVIQSLNTSQKKKKYIHYMVQCRIRAEIANSGCDNFRRWGGCFYLVSVRDAWHSVLHWSIALADSRNGQKHITGKKTVWRPLVLFFSPLSRESAKKRKGCGPHLVTHQHATQYGVCKLWMINTQKAVLLLTQEAEACQGTLRKWCRNL